MYDIDKVKLGTFISVHRKKKGYTQKELAEHLFISDKAVSKWETGISIPDAALWIPLADLLDVTVTELLLSQSVDEANQMTSDQVETLVKKAICFSDDNAIPKKKMKKQWVILFIFSLIISVIEIIFLHFMEISIETIFVYPLLAALFGSYFVFFAKEKLPTYYDENKITSYSDGFFRMNIPGLSINNSNWNHILTVGRIWAIAVLIGFPAFYGILNLFNSTIWNNYGLYFSLIVVLLGLFLPLYIQGKKYQ